MIILSVKMEEKMSISDKINICYDLVDKAETMAYNGFHYDSNKTWTKAAQISSKLLSETDKGYFMDEEFNFLTHVASFLKDD